MMVSLFHSFDRLIITGFKFSGQSILQFTEEFGQFWQWALGRNYHKGIGTEIIK